MSAPTRFVFPVAALLLAAPGLVRAQTPSAATAQEPVTTGDPGSREQPGTQGTVPKATPASARPAWEIKAFGLVGYTGFGATDTFKAVLDESGGPVYGGGAMVGHRSGYFFQAAVERFAADGERVFLHDGEVFKLGIPLSVTVTPIEFTGGYRFLPRPRTAQKAAPPPPRKPIFKPARPRPEDEVPPPPPPQTAPPPPRRWVPYVGGGAGVVLYKETSDFAVSGDDVDESFTSYHVLGGIDSPVWRWIGAGVEFAYRWVPSALGDGGVSKEYDETDLGGFAVRVRVTVGK